MSTSDTDLARLRIARSGSFLAAAGTTLLSAAMTVGCGGAQSAPTSMPSEMPSDDAVSDDLEPADDAVPTEDAASADDAMPSA